MALTPEQIETINAHGPYNHSVWRAGDVTVTNEEALAGRADHLAELVTATLADRMAADEIARSSIADVGCYDGWLLEQGVTLPFARRVGIEPREKNITKGHVVRDTLGLPTRAEYVCAGLEDLPDDRYDVVLCAGLLHHVENPAAALRALRAITGRLLLIDTHVLPRAHMTEALRADLELKDVAYRYTEQWAGVTGQKFESSYYDGSVDQMAVVSIPSIEALLMHLTAAGFDATVVVDPDEYHAAGSYRRWASAFIAATPAEPLSEQEWIADYELGMAATVLPLDELARLHNAIGSPSFPVLVEAMAGRTAPDRHAAEILATLRFNPEDKVRLEYGKALIAAGDPAGAVCVLKQVTRRLNADWRAVYRAHHHLARALRAQGRERDAERHEALLRTCNPRWPG